MERMQCDNCGYVYDKDVGDEKNGVAPGTAWEDVPADYKCPECGADKSKFIIE
jgi:rubredoxin